VSVTSLVDRQQVVVSTPAAPAIEQDFDTARASVSVPELSDIL
jgi:hypothetical protein